MAEEAIKIFYSYSRKDMDMRNRLENHLAALRKANRISTWHDLQLEAGTEWEPAILNKLDTADIILLLISSDFIDSEYCYGTELKRAITRHQEGTARVIPIILRPCDWNHSDVPFSKLNVLPTHAKAITSWADPEEAFTIVAQRIRETVDQLRAKKLAERRAEDQQRQQRLAQKEAEQQAERERIQREQQRQVEEQERQRQAELLRQRQAEAAERQQQKAVPRIQLDRSLTRRQILRWAVPAGVVISGVTVASQFLAQQLFVKSGTQKNQQGHYAAAIQDFDQAIRFNAQDATVYFNRGFANHRLGLLNAAVDDYTKALTLDNRFAEAFSNRSHARFDQGRQDDALKDATQAIAIKPKLAEAHLNLGNTLLAQGNLDGAFQKFSKTLQLNPSNMTAARAHNNQGNVFAKQKKLDEAIQAYTQANQLDATYADALFNRAIAFEQKGNRQGAIDDFREAGNLYKAEGNKEMSDTAKRRIEQLQKSPTPATQSI